jgi:hypothetical protein
MPITEDALESVPAVEESSPEPPSGSLPSEEPSQGESEDVPVASKL